MFCSNSLIIHYNLRAMFLYTSIYQCTVSCQLINILLNNDINNSLMRSLYAIFNNNIPENLYAEGPSWPIDLFPVPTGASNLILQRLWYLLYRRMAFARYPLLLIGKSSPQRAIVGFLSHYQSCPLPCV